MKYKLLTILITIIGLLMSVCGTSVADSSDSIEISVIPQVEYSIVIDTQNATMNFGATPLDTVKISTGPSASGTYPSTATIYNDGNVSADWKIRAECLDTWGLTAHVGTNDYNTVALDSACISVILTPTTTSAATINNDDFAVFGTTSCLVDTTLRNMDSVTFAGGDGSTAGRNNGNNVSSDTNDGKNARILWLRMKAADDSSTASEQKFRIIIEAWPSGEF